MWLALRTQNLAEWIANRARFKLFEGCQSPRNRPTRTMSDIAISVGEKCHNWTHIHLNKNSHTIIMAASQITRQGSADHFANSLPRNPSTMGIHSGSVCTMLRSTPWRHTRNIARQQNHNAAESYPHRFLGHASFIPDSD